MLTKGSTGSARATSRRPRSWVISGSKPIVQPEIFSEFPDRLSLFLALFWETGFILDGNDEATGEPVPSADHYLLLGGNGSSVGFHKHADSLVALLFGEKHWFLFPPETAPRPRWRDPQGMESWAQQRWRGEGEAAAAGSESRSEVVECVQRPGELL